MALDPGALAEAALAAKQCSPASQMVSSPAVALVTPSDTEDLPFITRWVRATTAGAMSVIMADGSTVLLRFAAEETRNICVSRIRATGTTATGIEAMK